MPTILKRRSGEISNPDAATRPASAISALLASVDNRAGDNRSVMSHGEFRQVARARRASCDQAWTPIRNAARNAGLY